MQPATMNDVARPARDGLLAMFRSTATEVVEKDFQHVQESTIISELAKPGPLVAAKVSISSMSTSAVRRTRSSNRGA